MIALAKQTNLLSASQKKFHSNSYVTGLMWWCGVCIEFWFFFFHRILLEYCLYIAWIFSVGVLLKNYLDLFGKYQRLYFWHAEPFQVLSFLAGDAVMQVYGNLWGIVSMGKFGEYSPWICKNILGKLVYSWIFCKLKGVTAIS